MHWDCGFKDRGVERLLKACMDQIGARRLLGPAQPGGLMVYLAQDGKEWRCEAGGPERLSRQALEAPRPARAGAKPSCYVG